MLDFKLELPQTAQLNPGEELKQVFDVIILGAGPAGMTAAVYCSRKQLNTLVLTPDLGGQVLWTSGVENYMGYQYITGPELVAKFSEQIRQFPLKLVNNERAVAVEETPEHRFRVRSDNGRWFTGRTLILATGKRSRRLGVSGEDLYQGRGVSYCSVCDGPFFRGLPVVVAGGGNSAVTAAIDLQGLGCNVTLVNQAQGWQADPILLQQVQGTATLLEQHRVLEVQGDGQRVSGIKLAPLGGGPERVVAAQGLFVEIGLLPNTDLFRDFVALNPKQEVLTDCFTRTSRLGVYAAGDCTSVPEKQIIIAAGDGAKAALASYRFIKQIPD